MLQNDNEQNRNLNKPPLTVIELFSGIGAQKRGIDLTGLFDCKIVATADINKDAIVSYAAIHNGLTNEAIESYSEYPSEDDMRDELVQRNIGLDLKKKTNSISKMKGEKLKKYYLAMELSNNLGDITKINKLPKSELWTYSFPCQDISVAGKQKGIIKGETRSGLLYEVERLLKIAKQEKTLPKYLLLENVKNLVGKQFKEQFDKWVQWLDELGFNTYWDVVNAKYCGVPQNRERVFALSIRKDIDTKEFEFAKPFDLGIRLIDVLDDDISEKYYVSNEKTEKFLQNLDMEAIIENTIEVHNNNKKETVNNPNFIGNIYGKQFGTGYAGCVWDSTNIAPTLTTMQGGGRQPHILCPVDGKTSLANYKRTGSIGATGVKNGIGIRKLTPKECFRLMGFNDTDYERVVSVGVSNSACYSQTGNSIVTSCISGIMEHLYKAQYDSTYQCFDENFLHATSGIISICGENKPILVGGIGEINYGKQYRQGNRIYDANAIAMCLCSQPIGNAGGNSYLYLVYQNNQD